VLRELSRLTPAAVIGGVEAPVNGQPSLLAALSDGAPPPTVDSEIPLARTIAAVSPGPADRTAACAHDPRPRVPKSRDFDGS